MGKIYERENPNTQPVGRQQSKPMAPQAASQKDVCMCIYIYIYVHSQICPSFENMLQVVEKKHLVHLFLPKRSLAILGSDVTIENWALKANQRKRPIPFESQSKPIGIKKVYPPCKDFKRRHPWKSLPLSPRVLIAAPFSFFFFFGVSLSWDPIESMRPPR